MAGKKKANGKKEASSIVRSSAAEYLSFVAASGDGGSEAVYADENIWLTQKMMGVLYDLETHTINYHQKKVFVEHRWCTILRLLEPSVHYVTLGVFVEPRCGSARSQNLCRRMRVEPQALLD